MAKISSLVSVVAFLLQLSLGIIMLIMMIMDVVNANNLQAVPIFIFGDSTVDVGTNNFLLNTRARANVTPNGIDYPHSEPTGRFSNGLNTADEIAKKFGYNRSPKPFLSLVQDNSTFLRNVLNGANFASGGSGIRQSTGNQSYGEVVWLGKQIEQFVTVQQNFTAIMGPEATWKKLSESLFIISVGSNDLFDYNETTSGLSKEGYLLSLNSTYRNHLENLYSLGARKFGIVSVPPIGCCPAVRAAHNATGCVEELNAYARIFHTVLDTLLSSLSSQLIEMKYALGNAYEMTMEIIEDPSAFGIEETNSACCGNGNLNGEKPCAAIYHPNVCAKREKYLFWDLFHPTQEAAKIAARTLHGGGKRFVAPINFSQLAAAN
ncbi:hypothetical protein FEM48_Zijuj08G0080900 [Ziziphus jujuba var. spinosa]|uniref:GDSL esterase/lipase At5g55050-like n=1 Tax=Ziziphus jujuba var. spinosa TaxID=714518 RepID=A0A978UXY3_ZIZJJ|nr:hypothetical protein FEM48_Zijuj08G0080900 [Ziziphus jujuba var. spinosa]